ncbi:MAG TPA: hypothetical protein VJB39_00075 [Patescibacteria group bacterium]|nr:hypothetical protein [Patescibacteria group bacterium]
MTAGEKFSPSTTTARIIKAASLVFLLKVSQKSRPAIRPKTAPVDLVKIMVKMAKAKTKISKYL